MNDETKSCEQSPKNGEMPGPTADLVADPSHLNTTADLGRMIVVAGWMLSGGSSLAATRYQGTALPRELLAAAK